MSSGIPNFDAFLQVQMLNGIPMHISCDVEKFRSALNYKAQSDDIFLVVYAKSGATWMETILYALMHNGEAFDHDMADYFARTPLLEIVGEPGIKKMRRPCVIKTHLPFNRIPYNKQAKYVCVVRNPKDACVSYYCFLMSFMSGEFDKDSFAQFFEAFVNGKTFFGDYFEHLHDVWQHKNDANVFLTSYEGLKRDLPTVIRRLAQFMTIELNDDMLEHILTYSSFDYMKERFDKAYATQARIALANESPTAPWPISKISLEMASQRILVRNGVVGSWSATMTEEQSERLDKLFAEKTADMVGLEELLLSA